MVISSKVPTKWISGRKPWWTLKIKYWRSRTMREECGFPIYRDGQLKIPSHSRKTSNKWFKLAPSASTIFILYFKRLENFSFTLTTIFCLHTLFLCLHSFFRLILEHTYATMALIDGNECRQVSDTDGHSARNVLRVRPRKSRISLLLKLSTKQGSRLC